MNTKPILMVRSEEFLTDLQLKGLQQHYVQMFPEYRVVVMPKGLSLEFVWPVVTTPAVTQPLPDIKVGSRVWILDPKPKDEGKTGTVVNIREGLAIVKWDGQPSTYWWRLDQLYLAVERAPQPANRV